MHVNESRNAVRYVLKSQLRPVWWRKTLRWLVVFDYRAARPDVTIDVGNDALWVLEPNGDSPSASASLAQVTATPATHVVTEEHGSVAYPVVILAVPGVEPLAIGCRVPVVGWIQRVTWRGDVPRVGSPVYALSPEEWPKLVEQLGLAPYIEVKPTR